VQPIYQWTDDDDEVALDAITVGIGCDTAVLEQLGLTVPACRSGRFGEILPAYLVTITGVPGMTRS
jgi:hypothetical protein